MRITERRVVADNGVRANGNDTNTNHDHGEDVSDRRRLISELRGFAEGSTSARASLMRDAADALEAIDKAASDEREPLLLKDMLNHPSGEVRVYSREKRLIAGMPAFSLSEYIYSLQRAGA
jgi:hypothetical protein